MSARTALPPSALALLLAALAGAQARLAPAPQAVYFAPADVKASLDHEAQSLTAGLPEMLATSIDAREPIDRLDSADRARSVVTVTVTAASAGKVTVVVRLLEKGSLKSEFPAVFSATGIDLTAFRAFVEETANRLAPNLGPVVPESRELQVGSQKELVQPVLEPDPLEELDKRLELTLWASGLVRALDSTGGGDRGSYVFGLDILPLIAEADWFFSRNFGVLLSFYFNDTSLFDFGRDSRYDAYGLFLFPGIGLIYRTLGEISIQCSGTISAGWIYLSAKAGDIRDEQGNVVLAKGDSRWSHPGLRFRFSPCLAWCPAPFLALKASLGLDLIVPGFLPWYTSPLGDFQFLCIGVAYRL